MTGTLLCVSPIAIYPNPRDKINSVLFCIANLHVPGQVVDHPIHSMQTCTISWSIPFVALRAQQYGNPGGESHG